MVCALTHDDPTDDCSDRGWVPILLVVLGVGVIVAIVSFRGCGRATSAASAQRRRSAG